MARHYQRKPKPKRPSHGIDPWQVLAEIAGNADASPTARVAACRALITREVEGEEPADESALADAIALMKQRGRQHAKR